MRPFETGDVVYDVIKRRAWKMLNILANHFDDANTPCNFELYIGGGCLTNKVSDIDVFPVTDTIPDLIRDVTLVARSRNARTYLGAEYPIQLCSYSKPSLKELVDSFDYAHIQVGAKIELSPTRRVVEVYVSDNFIKANAVNTTWFTGSEYPLSSMIRAGKYYAKDRITRGDYIRCVIDTMVTVIRRGYKDYPDFKDQLDAVDLGLLPEELEEVERATLVELFELLRKDR